MTADGVYSLISSSFWGGVAVNLVCQGPSASEL